MGNHSVDRSNEKRTLIVVAITALTMIAEIYFGISSNSIALLSDGIHMGSHVFAIGLSWVAYIVARKISTRETKQIDSSKILSLAGYSSGLFLLVFAGFILIEGIQRFFVDYSIEFQSAIIVACIGLVVNIISVFVLHHNHSESDHNIKAAYLHVMADALTSLAAIIGLLSAKFFGYVWIDAACSLLSSAVIIKWSVSLIKESGRALVRI